jgi:hypothetical protein
MSELGTSEWWTYSVSDLLLFSPGTYYRLFELYNEAVWPMHVAAAAIGLVILALLLVRPPVAGRIVALLLAACWTWIAWAYLGSRYATINWAAVYFAYGFALQALLLLLAGAAGLVNFTKPEPRFAPVGLGLFVFALLIQPLIGPLLGRSWSEIELFGLSPDPTAVATLGVLLAADRIPFALMIVPLLWCAIGGATLWAMSAPDAIIMPAAGLLAVLFAGWNRPAPRDPERG